MRSSPEELAETYAGLTFKDIMMRIEEKSAIPFQASLIDRAEELVDRKLRSDVRAIDGVREAVAAVTVPRCICSNSRSERIEFMLEKVHLLPFFAGRIFSSMETPTGKTEAGPGRVPACRRKAQCKPGKHLRHRGFRARRRRRQGGRHARHRLHRRRRTAIPAMPTR